MHSSSPNDPPKKPEAKEVPLTFVDQIPGEGTASDASPGSPPSSGGRGNTMRFVLTLGVAALADGLEVLFPIAWIPIDLVTVGVFFLLWGFRWEVALVLVPELIPGVNVFPSWVLLALYMGQQQQNQPKP